MSQEYEPRLHFSLGFIFDLSSPKKVNPSRNRLGLSLSFNLKAVVKSLSPLTLLPLNRVALCSLAD